jgi:hypothetical protein
MHGQQNINKRDIHVNCILQVLQVRRVQVHGEHFTVALDMSTFRRDTQRILH